MGNWAADDVFTLSSNSATRRSRGGGADDNDEEALRWAALEKLPTYYRLRTGILKSIAEDDKQNTVDGKKSAALYVHKEVDVRKLGEFEKQQFIERVFKVAEEDNDRFLRKLRNRIERVDIALPTVEVRFQNLTIDAKCHVGNRALPTLLNTATNLLEYGTGLVGIHLAKRTKLTILNNASGIIKPSRMTLLLGPPSSGKTTLLLALAGKLDSNLKVK